MASSRVIIGALALLVAVFLIHAVDAQTMDGPKGAAAPMPMPTIDCGKACAGRCRLSSHPNQCKRACGSCCKTCSCVPPGTAGNYKACPCYARLTTHNREHKCP